MVGYQHGTHTCTLCHATGQQTTIHEHQWQLVHWPAYWGDRHPDVLVLGFSMGANQVRAARDAANFDGVAFHLLRPRLRLILERLGVRMGDQTLDEAMTARGRGLGFSSLSRCSLGLWNGEKQTFETSGRIMKVAPSDPWAGQVLARCARTYLPDMPTTVQRVVLLGTGDEYVRGVRQILRRVFDDFVDINNMAFRAANKTWVFAVHPSKPNRVTDWLDSHPDSTSGRKRELAVAAIAKSYQVDEPASQPSTIGQRRVVKRSPSARIDKV